MKKLLTGITLIAGASLASAENLPSNGFSYDYVQGIYNSSSFSSTINGTSVSADFTGFGVSASKLVTDDIFITAGYSSVTADSMTAASTKYSIGLDGTSTAFGAGYRLGINDSTDLNLSLAYRQTKYSATYNGASLVSSTDTTYPVTTGIRSRLSPSAELFGSWTYEDSENYYVLGLGYAISKSVSIIGAYSPSTEGDTMYVGVRLNY